MAAGQAWRPHWQLVETAAFADRPRADELLAAEPPLAATAIDEAFWRACHGRERRMAGVRSP
jgi:hypothetical protein